MQPKANKLLCDIRDAAQFILEQTKGKTLGEYESDPVLAAAVERKFIVIGEALRRLANADVKVAGTFQSFRQILAFRNIVMHGYDALENAIVWGIIQNEVPGLLEHVSRQLQGKT